MKVIAFDLVGVLVREKNIELTEKESIIERKFGNNYSDLEFINSFDMDNDEVIKISKEVINKLYEVKFYDLFEKIKKDYDIKIVIATNHISYVKDFIINNLDNKNIDDIIISADINMIKPNSDFYLYILNKYNIKSNELLFLDDNINNIEGANKLGINTIKVNRDTDLYSEIIKILENIC